MLALHEVDPLRDDRWVDFVTRHPHASVFHTRPWLQALSRTYKYEPVAYTDSCHVEPLTNALLFCRVRSWVTGRRLVSLPFSDHCQPLVEDKDVLAAMLHSLQARGRSEGRYVEMRPLTQLPVANGFSASAEFCLHTIDLRPSLDAIFARFHRSHAQRTIRKAERLGLAVEVGRSRSFLAEFYELHRMTRRRHGVPIQPLAWFENLVDCFGDHATIHLARHRGRSVAALMNVAHQQTLVYKYGCSDKSLHRYGAIPLLFWRTIQHAKALGFQQFDLGRSDLDNQGLLAFKDHFGAERHVLRYLRYTGRASVETSRWQPLITQAAYSCIPKAIQVRLGGPLYRHFA